MPRQGIGPFSYVLMGKMLGFPFSEVCPNEIRATKKGRLSGRPVSFDKVKIEFRVLSCK